MVIILGGGLSGLTVAYFLSRAERETIVFEAHNVVGGLARTVVKNGFRFDLGGHRFFTKKEKIEDFIKNLMRGELLVVPRKSKIYMSKKYFDYPLKPTNAIFGLGIPTTLKIVADYSIERLRKVIRPRNNVSLEDWVVSNFGRTMFNIYFKTYSEKVWGINCNRISAEWVAQRIKGLSLATAIKNAFFRFSGKNLPTLADRFLYPTLGIGRISERLQEEINRYNTIQTDTRIEKINHKDFRIESVVVKNCDGSHTVKGENFVSTIPITTLINSLDPKPPEEVRRASSSLRYRDLVIATIMINRRNVTDQTWIYVPEKEIPFGRIHEPTNWSPKMAPEGKTLLVTEYFCFEGDQTWSSSDEEITDVTVHYLEEMGFIRKDEVIDSVIVRVPKAYPILDTEYKTHYNKILEYLQKFKNLYIAGRTGMFKYYNMDHAMESGIEVAERILQNSRP
jgi:protoporphyrinogen oxidase